MADNVSITSGSGTAIATDDAGAGGHVQIFKQAVSTDGSAAVVPADATNGLRVSPSIRKTRIAVTPTISTSAYAVGDQVGGKMTFTSAALVSGGTGTITSATLTSRAANTKLPELELLLFEADPTIASVDNGAADITDANLEAARPLPPIEFWTANYVPLANNTVCAGVVNGGAPIVDFQCSGSANLFGMFIVRVAITMDSTTDLTVALRILQD